MKKLFLVALATIGMLATITFSIEAYAQEIGGAGSVDDYVNRSLWIGSGTNPDVYSGIDVKRNPPHGVTAISTRVRAAGNWSSWKTRGGLRETVNLAHGNVRWSPKHGANRNSLVTGEYSYVVNTGHVNLRQWRYTPRMTHQLNR